MGKEIEYAERINKVLEILGVKSRTIGHYALAKDLVGAALALEHQEADRERMEKFQEKIQSQVNAPLLNNPYKEVVQALGVLTDITKDSIATNNKVLMATCEALRQSS